MKKNFLLICLLAIITFILISCTKKPALPKVNPSPTPTAISFDAVKPSASADSQPTAKNSAYNNPSKTEEPNKSNQKKDEDIVKVLESPSGNKLAYIFVKNKGKEDEIYSLSIQNNGGKLSTDEGNAYITRNQFDIEWAGDDVLLVAIVEYPLEDKRETEVNGVTLVYGRLST